MGKMGYGYGSECHLLRFMGRHRAALDKAILNSAKVDGRIEWVDFGFDVRQPWPDREPEGLNWLDAKHIAVKEEWEQKWPQSGTPPNWDAIGHLVLPDGNREYLLVEAKAHLAEIRNPKGCGAKPGSESRRKIEEFFREAKEQLGITSCGDWLGPHYQFANRVAILQFLNKRGVKSRLVCIYFVGDRAFSGHQCPATAEEWNPALAEQDREILGDCTNNEIRSRIHKVFVPVLGAATEGNHL